MSHVARTVTFCLLLVVVIPFSLLHMRRLKHREPISHDTTFPWTRVDALPVWAGSRMLLHRVNPYSDPATRAIQTDYYGRPVTFAEAEHGVNLMGFAYPPHTAFVCVWLAWLPWKAASLLMFLASVGLPIIGTLVWLDATHMKRDPLILACVMASWPVLWGIRLENLSMIVIPVIFISAALYLRGNFAVSGLLLAAATVKPQLCWLLILWMLADSIIRHRWRFSIAFIGTVAALTFLSEIWLPGCFKAWLGAMAYYRTYTHVAVPVLPFALGVSALSVVALWRMNLSASIAAVLAMTVALCPTDPWTVYNYLLLFPSALLVTSGKELPEQIAKGFLILEFALPAVTTVGDFFARPGAIYGLPGSNFLLPLSIVVAVSLRHLKVRIAPPHQPMDVLPTPIEAVMFDCADDVKDPSQGAAPLDRPAPKEA